MDVIYEDVCELHCTDNDKIVTAEILSFRPEEFLKVSINRSIPVSLTYNFQHKIYIGSMSGLEFTTPGPKSQVVNVRHR